MNIPGALVNCGYLDSPPLADCSDILIENTQTPVLRRFCLPIQEVMQIAAVFLETCDRSSDVGWEAI
jgi:hypothetical protein